MLIYSNILLKIIVLKLNSITFTYIKNRQLLGNNENSKRSFSDLKYIKVFQNSEMKDELGLVASCNKKLERIYNNFSQYLSLNLSNSSLI